MVFRQRTRQVSEGRSEKAEPVGPLRHVGKRDGMDAGCLPALSARLRRRALVKAFPTIPDSGARRFLERPGREVALCRSRCVRPVLEATGPAITQKHLV